VSPVTVPGIGASGGDAKSTGAPRIDLEALAAEADRESKEGAERERREADAALAAARSPASRAAALFRLGRFDEARPLLEQARAGAGPSESERIEATAYLGSLVAMSGGSAGNVGEAMRLVNEAFVLLDEAVAEGEKAYVNGDGLEAALTTALLNRANVAASVPNEAFAKAETAAADFLRAAEIVEKGGSPREAADFRVRAGLVLEASGKDGEIALLRAASSPELSAYARLELARRGMP
jgi:tetratricopeptide (TPR) repeat protein